MTKQSKENTKSLQDLQAAYEAIPVPKEARERIEIGLTRARIEKKRSMLMKNLKRTGITAAAVVLTFGIAVNASPAVASAMAGIPVIGSIAKVITVHTYTDETDHMMAQIDVPQIDGKVPANAEIEKYAQDLIAQYEAEVAQVQGEGHYAMESSYQVVSDYGKYVSIQINTVITQASGAEYVKIFTVDKTTGQTVTLSDVIADPAVLTKMSENIREQMQQQMAQDESKVYFAEGDPGAFSGLQGDENFYFNEAGEIVIVFSEYEVAPGYMGTVSFTIPSEVSGL